MSLSILQKRYEFRETKEEWGCSVVMTNCTSCWSCDAFFFIWKSTTFIFKNWKRLPINFEGNGGFYSWRHFESYLYVSSRRQLFVSTNPRVQEMEAVSAQQPSILEDIVPAASPLQVDLQKTSSNTNKQRFRSNIISSPFLEARFGPRFVYQTTTQLPWKFRNMPKCFTSIAVGNSSPDCWLLDCLKTL